MGRRKANVLLPFAAAASLLLAPMPAFADVLVLEVVGSASVRVGDEVSARTRIRVSRGGIVRALRDDSVRLTVNGPYYGLLGGETRRETSGWFGRLRAALGLEGLLSAVLLRTQTSAAPGPAYIDLTTGGAKCAARSERPRLWYPAPTESTVLFIGRSGERETRISLPRGTSEAAWPDAVPLVDNASYDAQIGAADPIRFTLRLAETAGLSPGDRLALYAQLGCRNQLETALAQLPAQELGPRR